MGGFYDPFYKECLIVKDKPNLKVGDVVVDITNTDDTPKITIIVNL